MSKLSSRIEQVRKTALGLWDESAFRSGQEPSRLYRFIHFWVLVGRSFVRNHCPIHASALSYASLLALIPMLALAMSVTTSILKDEGADQIELFINKVVDSIMPPAEIAAYDPQMAQPVPVPVEQAGGGTDSVAAVPEDIAPGTNGVAGTDAPAADLPATARAPSTPAAADESRVVLAQKEAARHIKQFIDNTSSATLGIPAMIILIFVAISMLTRIEETFNDIWGVTQGRSWGTRIVLYWTAITLGPMLLAGALALASGPQFDTVQDWLGRYKFIGGLIFKLLPMLVLWLTFTMLYKAVPNTPVKFSAALVGGIVGGTLWQLNNVFGFLYVSRVVMNNKIYGSLGLVPVFMFGLYLSWLILLFGAQVAYAFQNRALYLQEKLAENVNQRGREFVALRLMTCLGQRFERGMRPPTIPEMSDELGIPSRLVQQVLQTLLSAHLVIEISGPEPAYAPARPLENINAHHVLMAMRAVQGQELITRDEPVRQEVFGEFSRIQDAEKSVACSVSIMALVNRAEARLELEPPPPPGTGRMSPALVPSVRPAHLHEPASPQAPYTPPAPVPIESSAGPEETEAVPPPPLENETQPHPTVRRERDEPAKDEDREFPL